MKEGKRRGEPGNGERGEKEKKREKRKKFTLSIAGRNRLHLHCFLTIKPISLRGSS